MTCYNMTSGLAYRHLLHTIHKRQSVPRGWECFVRPLATTAVAASETSPLFIALFSLSYLCRYNISVPRLALPPSVPTSSLALIPSQSPTLPTSYSPWRLLASSIELLTNKYSLLGEMKSVFEVDVGTDMTRKDASKRFKCWKRCLEKYTSNGFGYMNNYLRGLQEKDSETLSVKEEVHGTCQALRFLRYKKKSKAFSGTVYRGENSIRPCLARLRPGMIYSDKAFLSTSKAESVCKSFITSGSAGEGVQFTLSSRTGVDVKQYSKHSKEDEVLFMPGTRFLVERVERTEKVLSLHLKELRYQGKRSR